MGENVWRHEQEWPLARTQYTAYYFHSQGGAQSRHGDGALSPEQPTEERPDSYVYDPRDPVPTRGGNTLVIPMGVYDQRPVEERRDVLCYTSAPLTRSSTHNSRPSRHSPRVTRNFESCCRVAPRCHQRYAPRPTVNMNTGAQMCVTQRVRNRMPAVSEKSVAPDGPAAGGRVSMSRT